MGGDGEDECGEDPGGETRLSAPAGGAGALPMVTFANHGEFWNLKVAALGREINCAERLTGWELQMFK